MLLVPCLFPTFPLFAYSNVLTSWKNNTNVGEFSNIYCVKKVIRKNVVRDQFSYIESHPPFDVKAKKIGTSLICQANDVMIWTWEIAVIASML